MKVNIENYTTPYVDQHGKWRHEERVVDISIDKWDLFNVNWSIAAIAAPLIKAWIDRGPSGAPITDMEDVPEELRHAKPSNDLRHGADENFFKRWEWILGEMYFALQSEVDGSWEDEFYMKNPIDREGLLEFQARADNGLRLFGKYFKNLWD